MWDGEEISDVHIVTVILENLGRVAIDSSCFDQGRPIRLKFGVPVIGILRLSLTPSSSSDFAFSHDGDEVALGPDVLRRSQRLTVQVLTAGEPDLANALQEHLTGTEVEYVEPWARQKFHPRGFWSRLPIVFVGVMVAAFMFATALKVYGPHPVLDFSPRSASFGQLVDIRGSGFRPNVKARVSVVCGSADPLTGGGEEYYPLVDVVPNSKGKFRINVTVPNVPNLGKCAIGVLQPGGEWVFEVSVRKGFMSA